MNASPLVSIVIPHYNRSALLRQTLRSLAEQDFTNWEALVVDDGSDEPHWAAVQAMATNKIRVLRRTDGLKGPSRCRNLGATAACGEFLLFVDSDDILAPWCLSQRVRETQQSPDDDLWIFQVLLFRETPGDLAVCWNRLEGDDDLERFLRADPPWHTSSPIWRSAAFLALGGFNEKVMYGDDAELHVRALLRSVRLRKYPGCEPDVFIRRGEPPRITNAGLESLQRSRLVRLLEGTRLLQEAEVAPACHAIWEGQYFVEGEELLFNMETAKQGLRDVIGAWVRLYRPPIVRSAVVKAYFASGVMFRRRAYWLLRINRRLARMFLPPEYFPRGGSFQNWTLDHKQQQRVRRAMQRSSAAEAVTI